jgi:hypothetical protein
MLYNLDWQSSFAIPLLVSTKEVVQKTLAFLLGVSHFIQALRPSFTLPSHFFSAVSGFPFRNISSIMACID